MIVYPTAIGSEPDHPEFDTEPLWEQVIAGNGIANGTFMVAVNRIGDEPPLRFYGSSFISDPYGRVLVQAPRDQPAVLVADLDLDQRRDWLELFPFLTTRRPEPVRAAGGRAVGHRDVLAFDRHPGQQRLPSPAMVLEAWSNKRHIPSLSRPAPPRGPRLILILGALSAFGPLSIDMYLPGLPR